MASPVSLRNTQSQKAFLTSKRLLPLNVSRLEEIATSCGLAAIRIQPSALLWPADPAWLLRDSKPKLEQPLVTNADEESDGFFFSLHHVQNIAPSWWTTHEKSDFHDCWNFRLGGEGVRFKPSSAGLFFLELSSLPLFFFTTGKKSSNIHYGILRKTKQSEFASETAWHMIFIIFLVSIISDR